MTLTSRVLFRERQILRAADLRAEQEYLLGLAGRHHVAPHTWGIVHGLSISLQDGVATVQPGLAIDGYGRELAVFQPVHLTFSEEHAPQYVYVCYCERPQGACGSAPNPRFRDSAEMQITHASWPIPTDDPPLAEAIAAGRIPGSPPWPVLLGVIKAHRNNVFHVHYSLCAYTRLRSSLISSPADGTLVRVGQENLADPYYLRISLKDATNNLQNRFALDRDGNAIFWGSLIVTSAHRIAVLPTQMEGIFLRAQVKSTVAGAVRVQSIFTRETPSTLTVRFHADPSQGIAHDDVLTLHSSFTSKELKGAISKFNQGSFLVHLKQLGELRQPKKTPGRRSRITAPPRHKGPTPILDDRNLPVDFGGADLSFVPEDVAVPVPCDCLTPVNNPELLPEGLIFIPGKAAPTTPTRDIYSLHLEPKDQLPLDEVRISGGTKKDGDFGRHISICGQSQNGFFPLLAVRGNGSLAVPGDLSTLGALSHLLCVVGGTAQLPVVKPDPRDQLFNSLFILAFTHGILSLSSSVLQVTVQNVSFIESAQEWSYEVLLSNRSSSTALTPKSSSEIIWMEKLAAIRSLPNLPPSIGHGNSQTVPVTRPARDLPDGISQLFIEVTVAMLLDSAPTAGRDVFSLSPPTPTPIPVHASPSVDFSKLTDPIRAGKPFAIAVANTSDLNFKVTRAELTLPDGAVQVLQDSDLHVGSGDSEPLQNDATAPQSPAPHVQFTLEITYQWTSGGAPNNARHLTFYKTVKVTH